MRLIDADAIQYEPLYKENWLENTGKEEPAAWKADIDAMPSIEPEQRKGHWKDVRMDYGECSECGFSGIVTNFCPNCGADMRG